MIREARRWTISDGSQDSSRQGFWFQRCVWFPIAYLIFAVVGSFTSVVCFCLSFLLPVRWGQPLGQIFIQRLFAFFVCYLRATGLACFDFGELNRLRTLRGSIIVVNHPSLLDAVFIVSRLPRVFCLMKAGILSNLVLCGTARLAGYVDNRSGKKMVEQCAARLRRGDSMVVFPEGTRTVVGGVNPFKMGFALIARLSGAPVQTVFLRANSAFLGKRWPFLQPPDRFPLRYSFVLGKEFVIAHGEEPKVFGAKIERYFRDGLAERSVPFAYA